MFAVAEEWINQIKTAQYKFMGDLFPGKKKAFNTYNNKNTVTN